MSVRELIPENDERLFALNQEIHDFDEGLESLVTDLTDTMRDAGLIGIAAPQIGVNLQVFITEPRETEFRPKDQSDILRVFINPEIVYLSPEKSIIYEGCGSVDSTDSFGPVERPKIVSMRARDVEGRIFELKADGILGRVMIHEYDHLQGRLFDELVTDKNKIVDLETYTKEYKSSDLQIKNSEISIKEFRYLDN